MKDTELRKGNLVDTGRGITPIHQFVYDQVRVYLSPTGKQPRRFGFLISDLKPVPLTEEWLVKVGFEHTKSEKSDNYKKDGVRFTFVKEGRFKGKRYLNLANVTFEDNSNCDYVHQLQNIFHCLTGKELEINNQ